MDAALRNCKKKSWSPRNNNLKCGFLGLHVWLSMTFKSWSKLDQGHKINQDHERKMCFYAMLTCKEN